MPKLKSHRGAAKRFKKTGSGKIVRRQAMTRHILTSKSRQRKRRLGRQVEISAGDYHHLKHMLL